MPWTWFTKYSSLDQPKKSSEKTTATARRTTTIDIRRGRTPTHDPQTGEGTEVPAIETIYDEDTGAPVSQQFVCEAKCEGFDSPAGHDDLRRPRPSDQIRRCRRQRIGSRLRPARAGRSSPPTARASRKSPTTKNRASPTEMTDSAAGTFKATYNADGQMTEQLLPNGLAQKVSYDPEGTAVGLEYEKETAAPQVLHLALLQPRRFDPRPGSARRKHPRHRRIQLRQGRTADPGQGNPDRRKVARPAPTPSTKIPIALSKTTCEPKEGGGCSTESEGEEQTYTTTPPIA